LKSGALLGSAGDGDCRALENLFDKVKTPRAMPPRKDLVDLAFDYAGILVLPSGRIFHVQIDEPSSGDKTHWAAGLFEIAEDYHAIGTGRDHAITAMECGKSARDAVHLAIRRNMYCRAPVYTMTLVKPLDKQPKTRARRHA
jgi:hypothetical protein